MKRFVLAVALVAVMAQIAEAGPIRRAIQNRRGGGCGCSGGGCSSQVSSGCSSCGQGQPVSYNPTQTNFQQIQVPCSTCPSGFRYITVNPANGQIVENAPLNQTPPVQMPGGYTIR